jgi:hypothetical protein
MKDINKDGLEARRKYYGKMAQWTKEIGLVAVTILVVQPLVSDKELSVEVTIFGFSSAVLVYLVAHIFLKRSYF